MSDILAHHDSPEPQLAFVAMFDVLGFSERVRMKPLCLVLEDYQALIRTKQQSSGVAVLGPHGSALWRVGTTIFSDTILLWCDDQPDAAQTLLQVCAGLIADALRRRIPLRGGVAYGEVVLDRTSRIFVGQPIVDAYRTEQSQQWIGGALHSSVLEHPKVGVSIRGLDTIIRTRVPTKPKARPLEFALHWGPYAMDAVSTIESLAAETHHFGALRKYAGARRYLRAYCQGTHAIT